MNVLLRLSSATGIFALMFALSGTANANVFGTFSGKAKATSLMQGLFEVTSGDLRVTVEEVSIDEVKMVSVLVDWNGFAWAPRYLIDGDSLATMDGEVVGTLTTDGLTIHETRTTAGDPKVVTLYSMKRLVEGEGFDFRYQAARSTDETVFAFSLVGDVVE